MSLVRSGLCVIVMNEVLQRSRGLIGGGGGGGGFSAVPTTLEQVHVAALTVPTTVLAMLATAAAKWAAESTDKGVDVKPTLICTS